jgi:hypothetical protein
MKCFTVWARRKRMKTGGRETRGTFGCRSKMPTFIRSHFRFSHWMLPSSLSDLLILLFKLLGFWLFISQGIKLWGVIWGSGLQFRYFAFGVCNSVNNFVDVLRFGLLWKDLSLNIVKRIPTCLTSVYNSFLDFHHCRSVKSSTIFYKHASWGVSLQRILGQSLMWNLGPLSKSYT